MLLLLVGFYATLIGKDIFKITEDINLALCFLFLLIAFGIIIIGMFRTVRYNKLIRKKDSIIFIENDSLQQFNIELFSSLEKQNISYIISLVSIAFSLFSLINCFLLHILWFNTIVLILCLMFGFAPSYLLSCLKLSDYIRTNLPKIIIKVKIGFKYLLSKLHEKYLTIVNAKYLDYIILGITILASLVVTFVLEQNNTNSNVYLLLSVWFIFSEILLNYFEDYTQVRNHPKRNIILITIIGLVITIIVELWAIRFEGFQLIEKFLFFASFFTVLLKNQQFYMKNKKK